MSWALSSEAKWNRLVGNRFRRNHHTMYIPLLFWIYGFHLTPWRAHIFSLTLLIPNFMNEMLLRRWFGLVGWCRCVRRHFRGSSHFTQKRRTDQLKSYSLCSSFVCRLLRTNIFVVDLPIDGDCYCWLRLIDDWAFVCVCACVYEKTEINNHFLIRVARSTQSHHQQAVERWSRRRHDDILLTI